jgi:ATP-binding cassette subfamily B protein
MLIWPVRNLGRTLANFSKATVSAKRIHEILVEEPETVEDIKPAGKNYTFNSVEFKNVSFGYTTDSEAQTDNAEKPEARHILKNVSFKVEKGKNLGILGSTGSGKSTISYLLTRLYDIDGNNGEILIDGINIKEVPLYDIRRNISLVLQEPFLFSKTIKENIISPNPDAEEREMHHVASVANIHEAILDFPEKYDTVVGERGVTLSGGQKQRVAIARMLMQKAPVMIFDDSLSAVDTETDAKIRGALKQNTSDAAVIIISHRISTLMHSDYILILHDGSVEDFGTHDELIKREGTYKRIYDLQAAVVEEYK